MRGIDQTCKQLAVAVVLVSGALVLVPTAASAQFDIGGLLGAFHGYGGYRGHSSRHPKTHVSSRHESGDKDKDASDQDSSDQDAKADVKSESKSLRRQTSAPVHDSSQSTASDSPPSQSPVKVLPAKSDDVPAFSPSR